MNVSVIIPLHNAEKYIAKALQSCLDLPEVKEIIVVDDGYKDQAKEIVIEYQKKHNIIQLFQHPNNENKGAGPSRNLGIEKATQDYIAFLDADDFYLPHRFEKDKDVFKNHPDAEGCYNAIGTHFYSENAKKQFSKHFKNEITTVNPDLDPTPENIFEGLLGNIRDYNYFHLDGLTLKRESLIHSQTKFTSLKIHQDTEFMIRLSYHLQIYPAELINPVAKRGVHEENRITNNYQSDQIKQFENRKKMWKSLYNWSLQVEMDDNLKNIIKSQYQYYFLQAKNEKKAFYLSKFLICNPSFLKSPKYYAVHKSYFGKLSYSHHLFSLRNILIRYL